MLRNNKVNAVIAFVAAVLLWIYVVGQVNPDTTGRITGIPVVFAGEESLEENGLALVDPGELTVDIVVRGNRSDVRKVISNSDRITAVANVAGLEPGQHTVTLDITVPSSVDLQKTSMDEVTVEIDELVTEDIAVEIRYDGSFEEAQEPGEVTIDPPVISVIGASRTVRTIDHLEAVIPVAELSEKTAVLTADVIPVNEYGQAVEHVELETETVHVTVGLVETRTVTLKAETTGTPADGYEVTEFTYPETVVIAGPHSALADLTEVTAEPVDVTDLTENKTYILALQLPDGVKLVEPEEPEATITVKGKAAASKSFTFEAADIKIGDIPEGMNAEIPDQQVKVTVTAEESVLAALKKSDIQLKISADGLEAGEHEVPLVLVSGLAEDSFTVDPSSVTVTVTAAADETEE